MKQPDAYDDVAPSAPCAIAPGATWQGAPPPGFSPGHPPPPGAGLPVSRAAMQPNHSMTGATPGWGGVPPPLPPGAAAIGPGGVPYSYQYASAPSPDPTAPLLTPAPHYRAGPAPPPGFGGAGGGGYFGGGGYPNGGDFGMGTDLLYATRAMRHGFLRKVLGIVCAQLLLTAAIAAPFPFGPGRAWLSHNQWAVPLAAIVTFGTLICLVCSESARRSFPSNILLLGVFTAAQGVLVGVSCAAYSTPTVLMAVVMTAAVSLALVAYAMQTRYDFTASGGMLYSAVWILLLGTLASALLPRLKVLDLLIAGSGALVFCCYLVYDVQLLISGEHSVSISVDEPIVAALNIYVDLINVFLFILQLLGREDD
ncbi:hypothetical protein MNEG_8190 [Monoraphidium neglectum]|uniref:Transmembrane BAX inhibitor motif-containing protein 4 n=1 Tax=Monoraphidium neglectum TaxID=145388 RepID=A0A0D2N0D3_9CHLO|nr:hypothetical protein MNEG_8190 [Monoraphidium neglectum]KIY99770.1 hypothetical protein MNEG_8190 [Monoraphidium neglectum]|eukprot:XP_013898790.1 hypothetical protein MNEG_8190 [Monoraphidium neglectum]